MESKESIDQLSREELIRRFNDLQNLFSKLLNCPEELTLRELESIASMYNYQQTEPFPIIMKVIMKELGVCSVLQESL